MESRIRVKASGAARADDNPETLRNRLSVYHKNTAPLLDFYRAQGKLVIDRQRAAPIARRFRRPSGDILTGVKAKT